MICVLSIDWLSMHCHYCPQPVDLDERTGDARKRTGREIWRPVDTPAEDSNGGNLWAQYVFRYKLAEYGTRQFCKLYLCALRNEDGGWDDFAEVQCEPYSNILNHNSVIVRFVNRQLYTPDFWERVTNFLDTNQFVFKGITRIDICADFNQFATIDPKALIENFAGKTLRHIGRGVGALYFNHGILSDEITGAKDYAVQYTGLAFGTHSSDARVYLYNKSFELLTQGDKPWIRDRWKSVGLDVRKVWRLEVSLKSKGCKFMEKRAKRKRDINMDDLHNGFTISDIYLAFVDRLFSFIWLPMKQKNISREPRLQLFDEKPSFECGAIRNVSPGKRFEKMFIKALYQLGDIYRGRDIKDDALTAQALAFDIAGATDLSGWMAEHIVQWEKPTHK